MNIFELMGLNLKEAIERAEKVDPVLAEKLRSLAGATVQDSDLTKFKVSVNYRLEKFEGEYEPGKKPFEVIEGGDGRDTVVTRLSE